MYQKKGSEKADRFLNRLLEIIIFDMDRERILKKQSEEISYLIISYLVLKRLFKDPEPSTGYFGRPRSPMIKNLPKKRHWQRQTKTINYQRLVVTIGKIAKEKTTPVC